MLRASKRRVELFVVSAYAWNNITAPATTGAVKFNLAVAKILKGEKPISPANNKKGPLLTLLCT